MRLCESCHQLDWPSKAVVAEDVRTGMEISMLVCDSCYNTLKDEYRRTPLTRLFCHFLDLNTDAYFKEDIYDKDR